jgi:hypothetical protein
MLKRRDFLRGFIGAGVLLGMNPESILAGEKENRIKASGEFKELAWMKTIFCCFDNPALAMRIGECAEELNCDVFWGDPDSPDIIAIPYFIAVIDRGLMSVGWYIRYIQYRKETDDKTPLILVDTHHGLDDLLRLDEFLHLPKIKEIKNKLVLQFDPVDQYAIEKIIEIIRLERAKVISNWKKWSEEANL